MGIGIAVGGALAGTAITAYGQYKQGQAAKKAGKAQAAIARNNAQLAEERARDAELTGRKNASLVQQGASLEVGASRASAAARGVEVDSGSAGDLVRDIKSAGETDVLNAVLEGDRRARDLRAQASDFRDNANLSEAQGRASARGANLTALGTVLKGSSGVADKWASFSNTTAGA